MRTIIPERINARFYARASRIEKHRRCKEELADFAGGRVAGFADGCGAMVGCAGASRGINEQVQ